MEIGTAFCTAGCIAACGTCFAQRWPVLAPVVAVLPFGLILSVHRCRPGVALATLRSMGLCCGALCLFLFTWWALASSRVGQARPLTVTMVPALLVWLVATMLAASL